LQRGLTSATAGAPRAAAAPLQSRARGLARLGRVAIVSVAPMTNEPNPAAPVVHGRIEILSSILLAAATVSSAWCAYQASVWGGMQMRALAAANLAQFAASRESAVVNRNLTVDVGTFLQYVGADLRGEKRTAGFLLAHARPELRPALVAWSRDAAAGRDDAPLPFLRPEYKLAASENVRRLDERVADRTAAAAKANSNGDAFVLHTVLLALSMFFLGSTSQTRRRRMQVATLGFGAIAFGATLFSVARLPRAGEAGPSEVAGRS
jgi:hypothetical protein